MDDLSHAASAEPGTGSSEPAPVFEVVYSLSPEEMTQATLSRLEVAQAMRRMAGTVRGVGIFAIVAGLLLVALSVMFSYGSVDPVGLVLGLALVVIGAVYAARAQAIAFGRTRKVNEKIFRERWTPAMSLPTRLVMTERGIATASELSSGSIAWQAFVEVQRLDTMLVLWLGPTGVIVPKRVFTSSEEFDRFARWAEYWQAGAAAHPQPIRAD